jgi:ribosomal-protein-alanine N-acetyltransferase
VHGGGYATEAGRAVLDFAFGPAGLERLIAITREDNLASRRVMAKLGFRFEREVTFKGYDVLLHGLARPAAQSRA